MQAAPEPQTAQELPKLSPSDFRAFNRLAEHMDLFVRTPRHAFPEACF